MHVLIYLVFPLININKESKRPLTFIPVPQSLCFCVARPRMRWRSFAVRCWRSATCSRRRRCSSCRSCVCSWSRPTRPAASCSTASARPSAAASGWLRRVRWTGSWSGAWSTTSRSDSRSSSPLPPPLVYVGSCGLVKTPQTNSKSSFS